MNFADYKSNINIIADCKPVDGWDFERILTLLKDIVLDLDAIQKHTDDGIDKINDVLDKGDI